MWPHTGYRIMQNPGIVLATPPLIPSLSCDLDLYPGRWSAFKDGIRVLPCRPRHLITIDQSWKILPCRRRDVPSLKTVDATPAEVSPVLNKAHGSSTSRAPLFPRLRFRLFETVQVPVHPRFAFPEVPSRMKLPVNGGTLEAGARIGTESNRKVLVENRELWWWTGFRAEGTGLTGPGRLMSQRILHDESMTETRQSRGARRRSICSQGSSGIIEEYWREVRGWKRREHPSRP